jgi:hypothetical protein
MPCLRGLDSVFTSLALLTEWIHRLLQDVAGGVGCCALRVKGIIHKALELGLL